MTITVIEANMTGFQHAVINRVTINMLLNMPTIDCVNLFCSKSHYETLKISDSRVVHFPVRVLKPGKYRIAKFFLESWQTFRVIRKSHDDLIYLLSCFPNVHYFLTKFSKVFKSKKVLITVHGEAEGLVMPGKWKIWSYPFWITRTFKLKVDDNIHRVVLGESIYMNLRKLGLSQNVYYMEHPYEDFKNENSVLPSCGKNIFAYVGNCIKRKGGLIFVDAANKVDSAAFWVIGSYNVDSSYPANCSVLSDGQMLSYDKFNTALEQITYACYPYAPGSYRFTASGAIFDAIKYLKPLIYIGNDYFDSIIGDLNVGYRCKDAHEFIDTIIRVNAESNENMYRTQIENLKQLQRLFTPEVVSHKLFKIISSVLES